MDLIAKCAKQEVRRFDRKKVSKTGTHAVVR
jgi:hypothetical protein